MNDEKIERVYYAVRCSEYDEMVVEYADSIEEAETLLAADQGMEVLLVKTTLCETDYIVKVTETVVRHSVAWSKRENTNG